MPGRIDLSNNASVRMISLNVDNLACAYLANLYIPIFTLDTEKVLRRYEVPNQISGLHFSMNKKNVIYAVDDSFGLHVFDVRTDTKKKHRLNPECENHNVVCTALSSNNEMIAVASSEFGGGILDVRGSRRREHHAHVISLYDARYPTDPITSYYKRHKASVTSMEFYLNGNYLITGDNDGAIKSFDCSLRDEDNAIRWERWVKGPISKVGVINKRIVYGVSNRSEGTVFVDAKGSLEVLYGSVNNSADEPIVKHSKAFFKKPEWCVGLIKGVTDDIPLVAVHGVEKKKFISLTAMNQEGVRQDTPLLSYTGHTGEVKCMTATPNLLLTGGEDGKVVVQIANFKNPKFGEDNLPSHHRLTLRRGKLAEQADRGESGDSDSAGSDLDSDSNNPSTSAAASSSKSKSSSSSSKEKTEASSKPKKDEKEKKEKKEKKKDQPLISSAGASSSSTSKPTAESSSKSESDKKKEQKEKEKEKERKERKEKKEKGDQSSTSSTTAVASSSSSSSRHETKEERRARKEKEAAEEKAKLDAKLAAMTAEERKAWDEREKRRLAKLAETPEQRAERKQKAREERERIEKLEKEERRKKRREEKEAAAGASSSKKSKTE
ncbi:hypothetical protein L3Y34_012629 [Caenorhabditis briggsae]|uniref:WD repeat-containing protein 89 n=2 Tax=Caenorhabditis briggsae TaxID=6238 RepID=A0AAE8ZRV2_CAEBR|nr:hypothetical protein L3Y34_012629 [Caenorhabditis briggsae]